MNQTKRLCALTLVLAMAWTGVDASAAPSRDDDFPGMTEPGRDTFSPKGKLTREQSIVAVTKLFKLLETGV